MTTLQARLFAARSVRAARAQEDFARQLRPGAEIPAQRTPAPTSTKHRMLTVVTRDR